MSVFYWVFAFGGWLLAIWLFYRSAEINREKQEEIAELRRRHNDYA
jgi:hypothetical protein